VTAPTVTPPRQAPREDQVLSPHCRTALHPNTPDDWPYGHPACQAPGYRHPVLGFMKIACTCECHDDQVEE
jgi:hypothetical protein